MTTKTDKELMDELEKLETNAGSDLLREVEADVLADETGGVVVISKDIVQDKPEEGSW